MNSSKTLYLHLHCWTSNEKIWRRSKKLSESYVKNTLEKGHTFIFENDCHDDYYRFIRTINLWRGECFKSLRKNERPHNVNSCNKCSCTARENVFEFTEFPRTGMCTTPKSSTYQGPWVWTLIHVMSIRHIMSSILITGRNVDSLYAARQHPVQNKERPN